ncbi:MAG: hypothetical protein CVT74_07860 [Alphaproteobacteria bacterium HGW-Alphaproteobacteria-13]|nr:MAG: hypothetical protein CVT74_07860 [Alphaproteobacteria bacterium HGW-Alphaproteobacteria-13]
MATKKRAKKRAGVPKRSRAKPHSRAPETSLRGHAKPSTGRFGCSCGGRPTGASSPNQSRTNVTSPNGTPVCAMPNGPGFIPSNSTSFCKPSISTESTTATPATIQTVPET